MKTLEFRLSLSDQQRSLVDKWLDSLKSVWNRALDALEEFERFHGWYCKETKSYLPCCPVPWEYRVHYIDTQGRIISDRSAKKKGTVLSVPFSRIVSEKSRVQVFSCPILRDWFPQTIQNPKWDAKQGLATIIRSDMVVQYPWILSIPYKYRAGTIHSLSVAWQEYIKSRVSTASNKKNKSGSMVLSRGKPKYKARRDVIDSLVYLSPKDTVVLDASTHDRLRGMPKLGLLRAKGLHKRWRNKNGSIPLVAVSKIVRKASGYYLQLTGEIMDGRGFNGGGIVKPSSLAAGVDVGLRFILATDDPHKKPILPPSFYARCEKQLARLQKKIDKKRTSRVLLWLNDPSTTTEAIAAISTRISTTVAAQLVANRPLSAGKIRALSSGKNPVLSNHTWQSLKHRFGSSAREDKLKQKTRKLHEYIALRRKAFNHKISTYLVRTYGAIACENLNLNKMVARVTPETTVDGKNYVRNGATLQSKRSKSFADAGLGQLLAMVEQKCSVAGREFVRVPAEYTTQDCPRCDHRQKVSLSTRLRVCDACGFGIDQDLGAAIKIRAIAVKNHFQGNYRRSPGDDLVQNS